MQDNSQKDWIGSLVVAGLGAGVITSFAVAQGQDPFVGLGITALASVMAVVMESLL
ncbi:MAG: hypothetical protein AAF703_16655 [Cyanobacteria bacterium P01_D01_bin.105]